MKASNWRLRGPPRTSFTGTSHVRPALYSY